MIQEMRVCLYEDLMGKYQEYQERDKSMRAVRLWYVRSQICRLVKRGGAGTTPAPSIDSDWLLQDTWWHAVLPWLPKVPRTCTTHKPHLPWLEKLLHTRPSGRQLIRSLCPSEPQTAEHIKV